MEIKGKEEMSMWGKVRKREWVVTTITNEVLRWQEPIKEDGYWKDDKEGVCEYGKAGKHEI